LPIGVSPLIPCDIMAFMQNPTPIPVTRPWISDLEIEYVNDAIRNGWGARCYEYILRFEKALAQYQGSTHALATSSCTGAIHLAFAAIGLGPGDEVIVPESTWVASIAPIVHLQAKPVFVDVLPDTWCMDPAQVEAAITPRTKAIMPVHVYGNLAPMKALKSLAEQYGLFLIEDAAEALGSEYHGQKAGSIGDVGVFSFHGTKSISTGEGGALVTSNSELFARISVLADHGRVPSEKRLFFPHEVGYKFKMSNLQAAMGCAQLERAETILAAKRRVFHSYQKALADLPLRMNPEPVGERNAYWMSTVIFEGNPPPQRDALMQALKAQAIDSRPFFYPLTALPMFESQPEHTIAYQLAPRGLNLPSYPELSDSDLDRVCSVLRQALLQN
jgi:perosamine synthetase